MNDNNRRSDKDQSNFDLTTPNLNIPERDQLVRPSPTRGDDFDRTSVNRPRPPRESGTNRPAAPARHDFDLTLVNFGVPIDEDEEPAPPLRPAASSIVQPATRPASLIPPAPTAQRGVPLWGWLTLGGLALLLSGSALALFFYLSSNQAFTLRVLHAPPGSKVYIDDIPSGVPQSDGTILVQGLRVGEPREVRVTQTGYTEWKTTVTGQPGQVQDVTVNLTSLQAKLHELPSEIDYQGRMVLIPAGEFPMGSQTGEADEQPVHQVNLPAYYIDKFEVTNEQYAKFCAATKHPRPVNPFWDRQYFENNPQMPVIGISYADAISYAAWAGKRLPTESEWEKAASWGPNAKTKRRFPWGETPEPGRANLGTYHPSNVGQYANGASAYGVHDMSGNAREWVETIYSAYPGSTQANPQFEQGLRVIRGGDFRADIYFVRTTSRLAYDPGYKTNPGDEKTRRSSLIGFRCAIAADDPKLQAHLQQ